MVNIYWLTDSQGTVVTWLNLRFCRLLSVSFHPKEVLRNLKILKFAKFDFEMAALRYFFCHKNQPSAMHPMWSIYIS